MKIWIRKHKNKIVIFIYAIITFMFVCKHEQWKDEAQAWLLAKELDFVGILKQMKYEGHPYLWYLILMPFAKLGFPYITENIISWLICAISAILILKKSPFKFVTKILIIFSMPLFYLYPVISRSYCLIPLATALMAITYKTRKEKPIKYILTLSLLANTHIIMLGLVAMLMITFYIEELKDRKNNTKLQNRNIIISFILICIILLISYLPILQCLNSNSEANEFLKDGFNLFDILTNVLLSLYYLFGTSNDYVLALFLIIIIYLAIKEWKINKINSLIIYISIFYQIFIYSLIWYTSFQRANSIIFIIMFFCWIQKYDNEEIEHSKMKLDNILIYILLIENVIIGIGFGVADLIMDYSKAYKAADFIEENISNNSTLISIDVGGATAILPYLEDYDFWSITQEEYFKYSIWNRDWKKSIENVDLFKAKIKNNFDEKDNLYLINSKSTEDYQEYYEKILNYLEKNDEIVEIYNSVGGLIIDENYCIYKIEKKFFE